MEFQKFESIVLMQMLGNAMSFDEDNMETIRTSFYNNPVTCQGLLHSFTKYLYGMECRADQKIPVEVIREYFPGEYFKDIIINSKLL